jgi:hypothetical protein
LINRHTNRLPYRGLPAGWQDPISDRSQAGRAIFATDAAVVTVVGKAVQVCSAARFNCRELHEWLFASLRWSDEEAQCGDGLDVATLHLPPGGLKLMRFIAPWHRMEWFNKIGLSKLMAIADTQLVREAPGIVAIVSNSGKQGTWDAGRILLSSWVKLNQAGYAVHPYYVATDIGNRLASGRLDTDWRLRVSSALSSLREVLGVRVDEQIHMLLRIGQSRHKPVRSARLPVASLIDELK